MIDIFGNIYKIKEKSRLRRIFFSKNNKNRNNTNINGKENYNINERKKVNIILYRKHV